MKILWLSHNVPYPPIGGVLQRNYNLLNEVASSHEVHLVAFNQKALLATRTQLEEATTALAKLCARVEVLTIPSDSHRLTWYALVLKSLFTKDPYTINWLKSQTAHARIQRVARQTHFDVVHYDTISLAEYVGDTGDTPKVLNHHNVESAMMMRRAHNEHSILRKVYFYLEAKKLHAYEKKLCTKFNVNLVVSGLEKSTLKQIVPDQKVTVVTNGVDTDYFSPGAGATIRNSLLFTGRLDAYSNRAGILFFMRKIWPHVLAKIPDARLTVVGKNPPPDLRRAAQREARVTVIGFVPDARPYFETAEVYVCPIGDGGGTRLKILDAMAMGKAVVSTSIACEGIEVSAERNILIANTPAEFVCQIGRVLSDVNLRLSLGKEARRLVTESYSWKRIGKDLRTVYESLSERS